jgi:hypothetical protein
MNRIHRARLHPPLNKHPGWASLMNHTAAASGNPGKRGRQWLP